MRRHHDVRCVRLRFSAKRKTSDICYTLLHTVEKCCARIDALSKTVHLSVNTTRMLLTLPQVPPVLVSWAVDRLATVDYTVANRVTEGVSYAVHFVYDHNLPHELVPVLLRSLQTFDDIGSVLIAFVVWLSQHST